jgi:tetratricopeptide (TPR) repeat protein
MKGAVKDRLVVPASASIKIASNAGDLVLAGKVEEGLREYKRALAKSVISPFVYQTLADSFLYIGNYRGAVICLEEAFGIHPEVSLAFEIGNIYLFEKQYENALKYYKKALNLNPKSPKVLFNAAKCFDMLRLYDKAADYRKQAFELNPKLKIRKNKKMIVRGVELK